MGNDHKRQIKTGSEQDAYTGWRHALVYLTRAGAAKRIKRTTNRRERHDAKRELRGDRDS